MATPTSIPIDEEHFPDEKFRNWVLKQDYGSDGVLTSSEIAEVTSIVVENEGIADRKHSTMSTIQ